MNGRLTKSKNNKMIAGVCGGVAKYFDVDATLVRLLWVLSLTLGGVGFWAYIIAMIAVPNEKNYTGLDTDINDEDYTDFDYNNTDDFTSDSFYKKTNNEELKIKRRVFAGIILIGLGGMLFLKQVFGWFDLKHILPMILIVVGVVVILKGRKG